MSGHGGGGAPAKSAFERMIGRRTATEAPSPLSLGPDGALSASSPPKRVGFATHGGGGGGASPRTSAGGRGAAMVRPKAGAFPSVPPPGFSLDESAFGDDNQTTDYGPSSSAAASPATSSRHANSPRTFRSRGGGSSSSGGGQRWPRPGRAGGGGRSFAGGGGFGDDDDDDFELQTGTWDEEAVEEVYGCDPSAAAYSSSHAGPSRLGAAALSPADGDGGSGGWPAHYYNNGGGNGYGGRPPSRGASSVGGASSVDEDGFAIPPAGYASGGGGASRRDGGGGGKTRTRCRGISAAPAPLPTAAHATRSGNLAAPPPVLSGAFRAPAANSAASSSSAASIGRNKKLARKPSQVTQALQRRSRHDLAAQPRRRGRGDTSDDDDDEGTTYTTEVFLYAPSPAARPTRAPIQIPGAFVLPLQAEVEDATELLFMEFELC